MRMGVVAMGVAHHELQHILGLELVAARHGGDFAVEGWHRHIALSSHSADIPMAEQDQNVHVLLVGCPCASFLQEWASVIQAECAVLANHAQVPDLIVPDEVALRSLLATQQAMRVDAVVEGSLGASDCQILGSIAVLPIVLHEAIAALVMDGGNIWASERPMIVVAWHGVENLGLCLQRDPAEDVGRDLTSPIVEVVACDAPEVDVVARRKGVDESWGVFDGLEFVSKPAADPGLACRGVHTGIGDEETCDTCTLGWKRESDVLATKSNLSGLPRGHSLQGTVQVELSPLVLKLGGVVKKICCWRVGRGSDRRDAQQVVVLAAEGLGDAKLQALHVGLGRRQVVDLAADVAAPMLSFQYFRRFTAAKHLAGLTP
mmetsp:Transcript_72608/g.151575  ORF Transcript_72608/g.151575 Transcript_72608/m.151575 type:complete len:375 (+) Transcript_72608:412-1536(+)